MKGNPNKGAQLERYQGTLTLPSEQEPRQFVLLLDKEAQAVTIKFDTPVGDSSEWTGSSVRVVQRLKYQEIIFITSGFPKEAVEIIWKVNADLHDGTGAGVIVVRPNELRISGEKGFTLVKQA